MKRNKSDERLGKVQQYQTDISLKKIIIKIGIIIYFVVPILDELSIYGCIYARDLLITLPVIPIFVPFISNFFSLNWLVFFLADTPLSLPDIVSSIDSRFWLNNYFYVVMYRRSVPVGSFHNGPLNPIASLDPAILLFLEVVIFLSGLILFIVSVVHSSRKQTKDQNIVTTGIYKYVRHPQNLALIIMAFPFVLYVPGFHDPGICFGDLFCWVQFIILLTIYSDYTDYKLKQKFPEDFPSYYQQAGFFLPKLYSIKRLQFLSVFNRPIIRYLSLVLIYLLIVLLCFQICLTGDWLRII